MPRNTQMKTHRRPRKPSSLEAHECQCYATIELLKLKYTLVSSIMEDIKLLEKEIRPKTFAQEKENA